MDHFLFEFGIRALLVAAGTAVVLSVTRVRSASARHIAWSGVLLFMMLLPMWTAWGPKVSWRVLPGTVTAPLANKAVTTIDPVPAYVGTTAPTVVVSKDESRPWELRNILIGIYVMVASVLLLRLAIGTIRAHVLIRRATVSDGLLTSVSCASPITVGWFRPVAILPEQWRQWPQRQLDAVLTHEREHVRRHDPLVQWLALLNRAVFWFHPLAWWLERQLSALAEEACDAAVLARGHKPQDYSEYLLKMADSVMQSGRRVSLVGMAMPGSFLSRRIPRLFVGVPPGISRARLACAIAACTVSSMVFAALVLEAREPELTTGELTAYTEKMIRHTTVPMPARASEPLVSIPQARPVAASVPVEIQIDARIVTASKSFSREFGSQIGLQVGMSGQPLEGTKDSNGVPVQSSGVVFLMQPGSDVVLDRILATAEAGGSARVTSRPKVTTLNDVMANISQGTQIPVLTNVNNTPSVSFLTFALKIDVTPHVVDAGILSIKLSVENSRPDFAGAVNGIPGVSAYKMNSEVLMREGSTVMIGGIFVGGSDVVRQVPGLGAIPVIGNLFKQTQPNAGELLLFITPRIKPPQP